MKVQVTYAWIYRAYPAGETILQCEDNEQMLFPVAIKISPLFVSVALICLVLYLNKDNFIEKFIYCIIK